MMKRTPRAWTAITLISLAAGAAKADDAATVRISDKPRANSTAPVNGSSDNAAAPVNGSCDGAGCDGSDDCDGTHRCRICGCLHNLAHYCPSRGFRPPVTEPIYRDAVVYHRYWPDHWYGQPGFNLKPVFPQVYLPTDTTQLGFYYQRVPQWMPNPAMYPPAPNPSQWHRRIDYDTWAEGQRHTVCDIVQAGASHLDMHYDPQAGMGTAPQGTMSPTGVQGGMPAGAPGQQYAPLPTFAPQPQMTPAQPPMGPAAPPPASDLPPSASVNPGFQQQQQPSARPERKWLIDDLTGASKRTGAGTSIEQTNQQQPSPAIDRKWLLDDLTDRVRDITR